MRLATLFGLAALLALPVAAQTPYTLSGRVVEAGSETPVPGASVLVEGTSSGAATDLDGTFSFEAALEPGAYTVRTSFVGYRTVMTPVTLGASPTVDLGTIRLELDALRSDEVIVTGTGVPTERRQLGNSIGSISARDIADVGATSVDQAITGKVAGAFVQQNSGNPAGGISIRLRGASTALGSADPLYIVDGVIVDNSSAILVDLGGGAQNRLVDINPEDIERIEIVKGAAAAALYGSRANNGAVQIFTRRGTSGAPRVTLQSSVRTDAVRKTLDVNMAPIDAAGNPVTRYDLQDDIFHRSYGTEQYVSVSGGQSGTRYFASGGHFSNGGIVRGNHFRRLNGRLRLTQDLGSAVTVSGGINYTNSDSDDIPNGGLTSNYGALTGFIFGPNTFDPNPDEGGVYPSGILSNPLEVIERFDINQVTNRVTSDLQLSVRPLSGLDIGYTLGVDTYNQTATAFVPPGTTITVSPTGYARRAELGVTLLNHDLRGTYRADLTPSLASTTTFGASSQYDKSSVFAISAIDLPVGIETVTGGANPSAPGESRSERLIVGGFVQQTVGVADRLFLTGALRYDVTSALAEEERGSLYPKLSASYDLARESFWANGLGRVLPTVRFRASYGETGGISSIGSFDRFTRYSPVPYDGESGLVPSTSLGTPGLRAERQREIEGGVDFGLAGGRLAAEVTVYQQEISDLFLNRTLAPTTGFSATRTNVGELTNRGVELLIRALPVSTPALSWSATATFSANQNEIGGIENDVFFFPESFGVTAAVNGEAIGVFYGPRGFRRDGDGTILGQAVDGSGRTATPRVDASGAPVLVPASVNDDGFLVDASGSPVYPVRSLDNVVFGDPNPDWVASLINDFEIGERVGFRFQFDAAVGGDILNFTRRLAAISVFGTLTDYQRELEGELPAGYNGRASAIYEHYLEDGSYVKLREVALSYRVPAGVFQGLGLAGVRLTAYGRNLLSFDSYSGYDPEANVGGQRTGVRGFDFVEVPLPRTFGFTVSATL